MILDKPKPQIKQEGVDMRDGRVEWVDGNFKPLGDRMLVKPLKVELSTTIEAHWRGRTLRGQVVAVGPGEYPNIYNADRSKVRKSRVFRPTEVKVGDIVELGGIDIGGYAFPRIMYRGEEHVLASEKDVAGIHGSSANAA
jgi:co-chaperonin GroES (HSP10)